MYTYEVMLGLIGQCVVYLSPLLLLILFVALLSRMFIEPIIVGENEAVIIERLGKFNRVLRTGLSYKIAFFEEKKNVNWYYIEETDGGLKKRVKNDSRITVNKDIIFDPPPSKCVTMDNIIVKPNVVIFYRIVDPQKAVYAVTDLYHALKMIVCSALQNVICSIELGQYTKKRREIINGIYKRLESCEEWGIKIVSVDIQNLGISDEILRNTEEQAILKNKSEASIETLNAEHRKDRIKIEAERLIQESKLKMEEEKIVHDINMEKQKNKMHIENKRANMENELNMKIKSLAEMKGLKYGYDRDVFESNNESLKQYYIEKLNAKKWKQLNKRAKTVIVPSESTNFLAGLKTIQSVINTQ